MLKYGCLVTPNGQISAYKQLSLFGTFWCFLGILWGVFDEVWRYRTPRPNLGRLLGPYWICISGSLLVIFLFIGVIHRTLAKALFRFGFHHSYPSLLLAKLFLHVCHIPLSPPFGAKGKH